MAKEIIQNNIIRVGSLELSSHDLDTPELAGLTIYLLKNKHVKQSLIAAKRNQIALGVD